MKEEGGGLDESKKNKNRVIFFNIYINGDFDLDLLIVDLKV